MVLLVKMIKHYRDWTSQAERLDKLQAWYYRHDVTYTEGLQNIREIELQEITVLHYVWHARKKTKIILLLPEQHILTVSTENMYTKCKCKSEEGKMVPPTVLPPATTTSSTTTIRQ
jgi:hypothetical protein